MDASFVLPSQHVLLVVHDVSTCMLDAHACSRYTHVYVCTICMCVHARVVEACVGECTPRLSHSMLMNHEYV